MSGRRIRGSIVAAAALAMVASACSSGTGGQTPTTAASGGGKQGGILRIGTISYIDTLNPYNYIETQATNAMNMIYPQLVQYKYDKTNGFQIEGDWATSWETSSDGKDWTFHLHPG